ncbi:RNA-binding S4 domain-containing protein [Sinimarinibacterium thermocellulolyticum]|uniref:Heat shock protein 15 n=1 Tax=Sinimarinibacterium thermocellulolyticum TaxID=3170016 RepID=A0ABV2ACD2_9GAMM
MSESPIRHSSVRLDKWLWAARLFKTRTLAKQAIESGHVRYDGARCKVSKAVTPGAVLAVRRGADEIELVVEALSDQRRGAPEAQRLYRETARSVARRERERLQRKLAQDLVGHERPNKQQRRALLRLKYGPPPD